MGDSNNIFSKNRIKALQLYDDGVNFMRKTYQQASKMFTYASAYGQIMLVLKNLSNLVFFYVQDAATEGNILQARRTHNIYGKARLTGHNPSRGSSAMGEIMLQAKAVNIKVPSDTVYLINHMRLSCKENGLTYMLELSAEDMAVNLKTNRDIRIKVIEGKYESQTFTGTGDDLQSIEAPMPAGAMIDDRRVYVTVNGEGCIKYDSLYDMEFGKLGCMVKTGYGSGIDVFFGKSINSRIPPIGSEIRVDYLVTNGAIGNFSEKDTVSFTFQDTGFDIQGNEVDLNQLFSISVTLPPDFGADFEDPQLTKLLAPYASRNFIVHDERSIYYHFARMNFFSYIKVYRDNPADMNTFKVILVPNITGRMNSSEDYFSCDLSKFTLTSLESLRLLNSIEESGNKSTNISLSVTTPQLVKYVMFLFVDVYRKVNGQSIVESEVRRAIKDTLNTYLLTPRERPSKLPHSDIVRIIDSITVVDSVKVVFLSEQNEVLALSGDVSANVGFDDLGNINVADNQIPLLRGGWSDRDGIAYADKFDIDSNQMGSVNLRVRFID